MSGFNLDYSESFYSLKHLQEEGLIYQYFEDTNYNGRSVTVKNRELLNFASCSYLGLEKHPALIESGIDALQRYGTQVASPRAMISSPLYKELEELLSVMFPGYQVMSQTVTLAHCSALPLLTGKSDAIILDAYVHNSVRMASQLCKANGTFLILSRHNDMEHVKYLIYRLKKEGYKNIWYCADGVYSIHGNFCDIEGLHKLLNEEENFYAYVDDAHGTGWCGKNGTGYVIGKYGLHAKMIVVESFAKSMVCSGGGIIIPDKHLADYIRYTGQTMIFSGPIQPSILGALVASVKLHLSDEITQYQDELKELIKYFRGRSEELGLPVVTVDTTPIQLLRLGDIEITFKVVESLKNEGFLTGMTSYPAVAKGDEGIRITLTRHLTKNDIDSFLKCLSEILIIENQIINNKNVRKNKKNSADKS